MEEETAIPQIISAPIDKLLNEFIINKGAKCTKVLLNLISMVLRALYGSTQEKRRFSNCLLSFQPGFNVPKQKNIHC